MKIIMSLNAFTQPKYIDPDKFIENRFMKQLLLVLEPDALARDKHNGEYSGRDQMLLLFLQLGRPPSPLVDISLFWHLKTESFKITKIILDSLKPSVGDLVLICKETPGLGLITQILSPRRVMVRHKHRGSNVEDEYHAKVLALIFRPQTPTHFMSISNQPMPHLLENFWAKLKQKLT